MGPGELRDAWVLPIIAELAKDELGALTVGVVTKPFGFEGRDLFNFGSTAVSGVMLAGLKIIALPKASAGADFQQAIWIG